MVRRICSHCRTSYKPDAAETAIFQSEIGESPEILYHRGTGCNLCANTGYQGRIGIFEVMLMSDTIRKMLINNVNAVDIENQAVKEGLVTMKKDGLCKVKAGLIPLEEVLRSVFAVG
jgi:type II secretory ATPase GspE/PulE/Tfp pilus assembly ATPase PilB-like protein